jgi:RNA polymerase sigma factor (sigma-70 family)
MKRTLLHLLRARDPRLPAHERRESFGHVVSEHQDAAFAIAYAVLNDAHAAQDAALEAFIDAWRNLDSLREPAAFPAWFRTLVRSRALRHVRPLTAPLDSAEGTAAMPPDVKSDRRLDLEAALTRLPESEREAVVLFYVAGLTREETATFMGTSVISAKKRLARGLAWLRKELIEMPNEDFRNNLPSQNQLFRQQTLLLTGEFAKLLSSGRPILLALDDCVAQAGQGVVADAFKDMRSQIPEGKPIADAMRRHPDLFDPQDADAVLVGEETGCLDDVLRRLADGERFISIAELREQLVRSGRGERPRRA